MVLPYSNCRCSRQWVSACWYWSIPVWCPSAASLHRLVLHSFVQTSPITMCPVDGIPKRQRQLNLTTFLTCTNVLFSHIPGHPSCTAMQLWPWNHLCDSLTPPQLCMMFTSCGFCSKFFTSGGAPPAVSNWPSSIVNDYWFRSLC